MRFEAGEYCLDLLPDETRRCYENMSESEKISGAARLFRLLMPRSNPKARQLLQTMGIDWKKLTEIRLLSEPDENGKVLFLATARLCARLIRGGETLPRQSTERDGMSMVFLSDPAQFTVGAKDVDSPQTEIRFVLELDFDPAVLACF